MYANGMTGRYRICTLLGGKAAQEELKKLKLKAALEKAAGAWKDEDHSDIWMGEGDKGGNGEEIRDITPCLI